MVSTFYDGGHSAVTGSKNAAFQGHQQPPESPPCPRFLTADGSYDSHAVTLAKGETNASPRAGTPYPTITWAGIRGLVESPGSQPKALARLVVLSTYNAPDGRTHAVQRERGEYHGLAVDIDQGSPSMDAVVQAVQQVTGGTRAEVYSSSSAAPDKRKWRVLIPLATPITGADYPDIQLALFALLGQHGLECDVTLARTAQPVYLPNVPPERRDQDGRPAFYQFQHIDGPTLALTSDHAIVRERDRRLAEIAAEKAAAAARAEEYKAQRLAYVEATGDDFKPIQHFNDHHTVAEMLARYGFARSERKGSHWRSPLSQSGSYSTEDRGGHWVTVSNWANAHNVGKVSGSGHRYGDAFDLFAHFDHGGDRRAAVAAYAAEVRPRDRVDQGGDDLPPPEPRPTMPGQCRSLDDWRQEASTSRAAAIAQPGWHLDRSPTGSGKTHATITALQRASSSLTVLPTHANVAERVEEMRSQGIDAVAYPELNPDTCQNYDRASRAQSLGLVAGAAVCPGCDFKDDCTYRAAVKIAASSPHRVATHERLRRSERTADGVQVVVIDECPESVVAPTLAVPVQQLAAVQTLAHGIRNYHWSQADADQRAFAGLLLDVAGAIAGTCTGITVPGRVQVDLALADREVPKNWQRLLYDAISMIGIGGNLKAEALTLVTKAAVGDLVSLDIVTDLTPKGRLHHYVTGSWRPGLPGDAAVIMLDATCGATDIEAATGTAVTDCTPDGHLQPLHAIQQLVDDISRGTSTSTVAGVIEAFLDRRPDVERLGIIGHQPHITALIDQGELGSAARERVVKWCYFGQGPDRASNDWHRECDHLLVLGTPRANPGDHRRWLVQHGLHEAASRPDGDWGARHWESVTTSGASIIVAGTGYRDPDWHRAAVAVNRSTLHQAVGRGRSILPEGIPVTVVSSDPTPYPVAPALDAQPAALRATVDTIRGLLAPAPVSLLSAIESPYREKYGSGAVPTGDIVLAVVGSTRTADKPAGVGRSAVEKRLRQCLAAGLLTQPKRGWWSLPGTPAPAPDALVQVAPVRAAAPAILTPLTPAVVIEAVPPESADDAVQIVSPAILPAGTTDTVTTDAPLELPTGVDAVLELVEERAAILEYDGGHDSETADRLAREMVLGRDAATAGDPGGAVVELAAGVDHAGLHARTQPLVAESLTRFPGTVRLLTDKDDPFAGRRRASRPAPGHCRCGADDWVSVPIHGGRSTRVECRHCDRYGWWGVWYGKRQQPPWGDLETPDAVPPPADQEAQPTPAAGRADSLSFAFLPAAHALPTGSILAG
jgi:hypothetical protein